MTKSTATMSATQRRAPRKSRRPTGTNKHVTTTPRSDSRKQIKSRAVANEKAQASYATKAMLKTKTTKLVSIIELDTSKNLWANR